MGRNSQLLILFVVSVIATAGCSGKLACTDVAGQGIQCEPVSRVYEQKMLGAAPEKSQAGRNKKTGAEMQAEQPASVEIGVEAIRRMVYSEKIPVRIPPKIIRIWIAPWEDADGDLHKPAYIFSEITTSRGRWLFGEKEVTGSQPLLRPVEKPEETEVKEEDLEPPPAQPQSQTQQRHQSKPPPKPPLTTPPAYLN